MMNVNIFHNINDKKQNRVVVHCYDGISRSATIVIEYLMKMNNMNYLNPFKYVKQKRNIIEPNIGFIQQLKLYEKNEFIVVKYDDNQKRQSFNFSLNLDPI